MSFLWMIMVAGCWHTHLMRFFNVKSSFVRRVFGGNLAVRRSEFDSKQRSQLWSDRLCE